MVVINLIFYSLTFYDTNITVYLNFTIYSLHNSRIAIAQKDTMRRIFERFDDARSIWSTAVSCMSLLDALQSLAVVSSSPGYVWPVVTERGSCGALLEIVQGRHPMLEQTLSERCVGGPPPLLMVL